MDTIGAVKWRQNEMEHTFEQLVEKELQKQFSALSVDFIHNHRDELATMLESAKTGTKPSAGLVPVELKTESVDGALSQSPISDPASKLSQQDLNSIAACKLSIRQEKLLELLEVYRTGVFNNEVTALCIMSTTSKHSLQMVFSTPCNFQGYLDFMRSVMEQGGIEGLETE